MTAKEIAAALGGKRQADGDYMCSCPCPLHAMAIAIQALSVKDGRNRSSVALLLRRLRV